MLCPTVHRPNLGGMDILAQVLDRVRLGGTLLFHFELGHPWRLELPARPYALFHYLSQGSATLALGQGQGNPDDRGRFLSSSRAESPMRFIRIAGPKPLRIMDIDRSSPRLGVVRHGSRAKPALDHDLRQFHSVTAAVWQCAGATSARAPAENRRRTVIGLNQSCAAWSASPRLSVLANASRFHD